MHPSSSSAELKQIFASQAWLPATTEAVGDVGLDVSERDPSIVEEALILALASLMERS